MVPTEPLALGMAPHLAMEPDPGRKDPVLPYRGENEKTRYPETTPRVAKPRPSRVALGWLLTSGAFHPQETLGTKLGVLPLAFSFGDGALTGTPCSLVSQAPQHPQARAPLLPEAPSPSWTSLTTREGGTSRRPEKGGGGRLPHRAEGQLFIL